MAHCISTRVHFPGGHHLLIAAQALLTLLAIIQGLATVMIDFNRTHATHPQWTGHSRFHLVWQDLNVALFAVVATSLIWWHGSHTAHRFYLAAGMTAIPSIGFLLAQVSRSSYGGTLSDPNGIPPLRFRFAGRAVALDGNVAAVYFALVLLICLVAMFHHAARDL